MDTEQYLRDAAEHAPRDPGPMAPDLRGWWTPAGWYVCARCAGRIMARGCQLPRGAKPVWRSKPEPYGTCSVCE